MADRPRFIVVSGLPASGKTTLARTLAPIVRMPVIDKDDLLEALFDGRRDPDVAATGDERRRLSRAADEEFIEAARRSDGAILVSFWRRDELSATAGTPTDWLSRLGDLIELHCRCDPAVAADRFVQRRRNPGHGDPTELTDEIVARFRALDALGPLDVGPVCSVERNHRFEIDGRLSRFLDHHGVSHGA